MSSAPIRARFRPIARESAARLTRQIHDRAARNSQLGMRVSLRQAALLGASLYLVATASHDLASLQLSGIVAGCLLLAAIGAAWLGSRPLTGVMTAAVLSTMADEVYSFYAGSASARFDWTLISNLTLTRITLILALAGLSFLPLPKGRARPPLAWLVFGCVPLGRAAAGLLVARFGQRGLHPHGALASLVQSAPGLVVLSLGIIALAFLVIDTRPALGVAVYFVLTQVAEILPQAQDLHAGSLAGWDWLQLPLGLPLGLLANLNVAALAVGLATLAGMAWLLRRRTEPGRPADTQVADISDIYL